MTLPARASSHSRSCACCSDRGPGCDNRSQRGQGRAEFPSSPGRRVQPVPLEIGRGQIDFARPRVPSVSGASCRLDDCRTFAVTSGPGGSDSVSVCGGACGCFSPCGNAESISAEIPRGHRRVLPRLRCARAISTSSGPVSLSPALWSYPAEAQRGLMQHHVDAVQNPGQNDHQCG